LRANASRAGRTYRDDLKPRERSALLPWLGLTVTFGAVRAITVFARGGARLEDALSMFRAGESLEFVAAEFACPSTNLRMP
jgi:hypothetical protein